MPEFIQCPQCSRKLNVPDILLGKQVKCPSCGATFTAFGNAPTQPIEPPPPLPPQQDYTPAPQRPPVARPGDQFNFEHRDRPDEGYGEERVGNARDWQKVRAGVGLLLWHIFVMIGTGVLYTCSIFVILGSMYSVAASSGSGRPSGGGILTLFGGMAIIGVLVLVGFVSALVLKIVGQVYCLAAPARNGAKGLATTSFFLTLGGVGASVLGVLVVVIAGATAGMTAGSSGSMQSAPEFGAAFFVGMGLFGISGLLGLCEGIVTLFFLRAVALCVRADWLAQNVVYLMILGGITILGYFGMAIVNAAASVGTGQAGAAAPNILALGCACVELLLGLGSFVWYIVTLFQVRGAISTYLGRRLE